MNYKHLFAILLSVLSVFPAKGQDVAVKTNILADALFNINAGVEVGFAPQWTLDLTGQLNAWKLSHGRRWKHWALQPEARYWFCDRFSGHFLGAHLHGGQFNLCGFDGIYNFLGTDARKLENLRYQGWFLGGGVAYGYAWILSRHWNLEAEIGLGYSYTRYDIYPCAHCGTKLKEDQKHHYVGPTRAAVNLVYVF